MDSVCSPGGGALLLAVTLCGCGGVSIDGETAGTTTDGGTTTGFATEGSTQSYPCADISVGTETPLIIGEAWIREPTDEVEAPRWTVPQEPCASDLVTDMDVSPDGSIYVTGISPQSSYCTSEGEDSPQCRTATWLRQLSSGYAERWLHTFDAEQLMIRAVVATEDGGVVVAGESVAGYPNLPWIARYDAEGALLWENEVDAEDRGNANGLAVGPEGEIVVVGTIDSGADELWVVKLNSDGSERWTSHLEVAGSSGGVAVAVGPEGKIWVVGGWSRSSYTGGYWSVENVDHGFRYDWWFDGALVALLDPEGQILWVDELGRPDPSWQGAYSVAVLPGGDAVVGGLLSGWESPTGLIARYAPSGARVWEVPAGIDAVRTVAADDAGTIYAISSAMFRFDSDGKALAGPDDLWGSTEEREVGKSDALALTPEGSPLIAGYFLSGWFRPPSGLYYR